MLLMFNEPPYAERHVRWCEGTGNQIMITFLLDCFCGGTSAGIIATYIVIKMVKCCAESF